MLYFISIELSYPIAGCIMLVSGNTLYVGNPYAQSAPYQYGNTDQYGIENAGEVLSIDITDPSNPVLNWQVLNPNYSTPDDQDEANNPGSNNSDRFGRFIHLFDNGNKLAVTSGSDGIQHETLSGQVNTHVTILNPSDGTTLTTYLGLSVTGDEDPATDQASGGFFNNYGDNLFVSGDIIIQSSTSGVYGPLDYAGGASAGRGAVMFLNLTNGETSFYLGPETQTEVDELYPNPAGPTSYLHSGSGFGFRVIGQPNGNKILVVSIYPAK